MVFFENEKCLKCGESLGFDPETLEIVASRQMGGAPRLSTGGAHRNCANREEHQVCNWILSEGDQNSLCLACRLNEVIPDLTINGNRERWYKLEQAKRRCLYTLLQLGLPIETRKDEARVPLRFRFLGDTPNTPPVLTGHDHGAITVNISEADEDERERRRLKLHEPYRTLIGHFRHESGHYYWDRLIANSPHLTTFHDLFGDESADYKEALQKYYEQGPAEGWQNRTVTAYASLHPWEDWAETWAHYLHIVDTLETAASFGLRLESGERKNDRSRSRTNHDGGGLMNFEKLLATWMPLTCALNSINRSMGLPDLYPFAITDAVREKLSFIQTVIETEATRPRAAGIKSPRTELMAATN